MQLKKREAETLFGKLQLDVESSHHKTATFYYSGRAILRTRVSHGRGDIPPIIVAKLRSQLKVTEEQMRRLVDCSMSYEEYVSLLITKGLITD
ncbi:MAG: hypothetical protein DYG89_39185 [Caldilinea sp. CFX5]|nr:hypothetical protein [Caldilinea sp. CFX5]